MKKQILLALLVSLCFYTLKAQLVITQPTSINALVNSFILSGVTATNVTYTGDTNAIGSFTGGNSTNLGINNGIILTTGVVNGTPSFNSPAISFASTYNSQPGDALLQSLVQGVSTYDASVLEFDLVPVGNILEFQYVFGSEEYPEFVGSSYNDVFAFFISGSNPAGGNYNNDNIALIPGTTNVVCINNVNSASFSSYYVNNSSGSSFVFDGFTTVLLAQLSVLPGSTYHLKMAVADVGDGIYDSGVFLKAQSMKSYLYTGIDEKSIQKCSVSPNPLTSNSVLNINIKNTGTVKILVKDLSGKEIYRKHQEIFSSGMQKISLDGLIINGSGIYLMQVETSDFTEIIKIIR